MKDPSTVVGPYDDVLIPRGSTKTDWEVELGVVIGRDGPLPRGRRRTPLALRRRLRRLARRLRAGVPARARRPVGQGQELRDVQPARARPGDRRTRSPTRSGSGCGSAVNGVAAPGRRSTADMLFGVAPRDLVPQPVHGAAPRRRHQHGDPGRRRARHARSSPTCAPATWSSSRSTGSGTARQTVRGSAMSAATGEFAGLVAVVTGGGAGIGARDRRGSCAAAGRDGRRARPSTRRPAGALTGFRADVTDRASVDAAVAAVVGRVRRHRHPGQQRRDRRGGHGRGQRRRRVAPGPRRQRRRHGPGLGRGAAARCARSPAAAIVNICSIAALNGLPQRALYSASKGAVLALTFAMATDHVARGHPGQLREPGHRATRRSSTGC